MNFENKYRVHHPPKGMENGKLWHTLERVGKNSKCWYSGIPTVIYTTDLIGTMYFPNLSSREHLIPKSRANYVDKSDGVKNVVISCFLINCFVGDAPFGVKMMIRDHLHWVCDGWETLDRDQVMIVKKEISKVTDPYKVKTIPAWNFSNQIWRDLEKAQANFILKGLLSNEKYLAKKELGIELM